MAGSLRQVAAVHALQAQYGAADALYRQALHIYQAAYGPDHRDVAKTLDAMAALYHKQGK